MSDKSLTLIIPDAHEDVSTLEDIEKRFVPSVDRVVMLGDFFDTFHQHRVTETCKWILDHIDNPKFTFLLGNHDCQYAFGSQGFRCSGFQQPTLEAVRMLIPREVWKKFHLFTRVGEYLCSHAGFVEQSLEYAKPEVEVRIIEEALSGKFPHLFEPGYSRGGSKPVGGPTWLDWKYEFTPVEGVPQIVGHTKGQGVRIKVSDSGEASYCLDTALGHVIATDGKDLEILTV